MRALLIFETSGTNRRLDYFDATPQQKEDLDYIAGKAKNLSY
jgi:hypothetical protein